MSLDLSKIEDFFGSEFSVEPEIESSLISMRTLIHFDGITNWFFGVFEATKQIRITSDVQLKTSAFPNFEMVVNYSNHDVLIHANWDGGKILLIHPSGCKTGGNLLVLTKSVKGKISLSTTLGEVPEEQRDSLVQEWFSDSD